MATEFARSQIIGMDYHVRGTMLRCYQKYTPKPPNIAELKTASLSMHGMICHRSSLFIDKAISSFRKRLIDHVLLQLVDILTQFKYREGS